MMDYMDYEELQKEIFKRADQAEKQDRRINIWESRDVYLNRAVKSILDDFVRDFNKGEKGNDI